MRSLRTFVVAAAAGLLSACGPGSSVVLESPAPSSTATPATTTAPGVATAHRDEAASDVQTCIHRFDYIPPVTSDTATWKGWYRSGSQDMLDAVANAAADHFRAIEIASTDGVRRGFVAVGGDPVDKRAIVLVDPALVDIAALQRELTAVVQREHRAQPNQAVLPVSVLPSCFGGPALADAREAVEKEIFHNPAVHYPSTSGVYLDSRQPVTVGTADHAVGERLQRKYGPIIKITYSDEHGVPA
ncbi:MAG TPA: hypothetical protein VGJ14_04155 [Sporichthyaceae bacterium]